MPGPFRCTDMLVKIDNSTLGVVIGTDIRLSWEGGTVEHVYGSDEGRIAHGGKRGTFRAQRWFMSDTDTDLLFDLFDTKTAFELSGEIDGVAGSLLVLSNCKANAWGLITGDANSIVGEEISGEAVSWGGTNIL